MTTVKKKCTADVCPAGTCDFNAIGGEFQEQVCLECQSRFLEPEGAARLCQAYLSVSQPLLQEVIRQGTLTQRKCLYCQTQMVEAQLKGQWLHLCPGCGGLLCEAGELIKLSRGLAKEPQPLNPNAVLRTSKKNELIMYESSILPNTLVPYDPQNSPLPTEIMTHFSRALPFLESLIIGNRQMAVKEIVMGSCLTLLGNEVCGHIVPALICTFLLAGFQRPKIFLDARQKRFAITRMPFPWRWWSFRDIKEIYYTDRWQKSTSFWQYIKEISRMYQTRKGEHPVLNSGDTVVNVWFIHHNHHSYTLQINETDSFLIKKHLGPLYQLNSSWD